MMPPPKKKGAANVKKQEPVEQNINHVIRDAVRVPAPCGTYRCRICVRTRGMMALAIVSRRWRQLQRGWRSRLHQVSTTRPNS